MKATPCCFLLAWRQIGQLSQIFAMLRSLSVIESASMNASQMDLATYEKYLYAKDHDMSKKSIPKEKHPQMTPLDRQTVNLHIHLPE
jgi:hypothetical protein